MIVRQNQGGPNFLPRHKGTSFEWEESLLKAISQSKVNGEELLVEHEENTALDGKML